jgi:hypothetical protein
MKWLWKVLREPKPFPSWATNVRMCARASRIKAAKGLIETFKMLCWHKGIILLASTRLSSSSRTPYLPRGSFSIGEMVVTRRNYDIIFEFRNRGKKRIKKKKT